MRLTRVERRDVRRVAGGDEVIDEPLEGMSRNVDAIARHDEHGATRHRAAIRPRPASRAHPYRCVSSGWLGVDRWCRVWTRAQPVHQCYEAWRIDLSSDSSTKPTPCSSELP